MLARVCHSEVENSRRGLCFPKSLRDSGRNLKIRFDGPDFWFEILATFGIGCCKISISEPKTRRRGDNEFCFHPTVRPNSSVSTDFFLRPTRSPKKFRAQSKISDPGSRKSSRPDRVRLFSTFDSGRRDLNFCLCSKNLGGNLGYRDRKIPGRKNLRAPRDSSFDGPSRSTNPKDFRN